MAFARNHAERRVGSLLQSPSILRVASTGDEYHEAPDTCRLAVD